MRKVIGFKVDEHKTAHQIVVKHKVNIEVAPIESDTLLARLKSEAAAKLQQKLLKMRDECLLSIALAKRSIVREA